MTTEAPNAGQAVEAHIAQIAQSWAGAEGDQRLLGDSIRNVVRLALGTAAPRPSQAIAADERCDWCSGVGRHLVSCPCHEDAPDPKPEAKLHRAVAALSSGQACDFCGATSVSLKKSDTFTYCEGGRAACRPSSVAPLYILRSAVGSIPWPESKEALVGYSVLVATARREAIEASGQAAADIEHIAHALNRENHGGYAGDLLDIAKQLRGLK